MEYQLCFPNLKKAKPGFHYCPGKEAAMGNIVVSLPCTVYLWAALIMLEIKVA